MATISTPQTQIQTHNLGFSRPTSFLSTIKTTMIRDIRIVKRYKVNLLGGLMQVTIYIFIFSLFASAATFRGMDLSSSEIYTFYLSGMTLMFFGEVVLYSTVNTVNKELYNGTLEFVYSSPSSRYAYFLGGILADFLIYLLFYFFLFFFFQAEDGIRDISV